MPLLDSTFSLAFFRILREHTMQQQHAYVQSRSIDSYWKFLCMVSSDRSVRRPSLLFGDQLVRTLVDCSQWLSCNVPAQYYPNTRTLECSAGDFSRTAYVVSVSYTLHSTPLSFQSPASTSQNTSINWQLTNGGETPAECA